MAFMMGTFLRIIIMELKKLSYKREESNFIVFSYNAHLYTLNTIKIFFWKNLKNPSSGLECATK